MKRLVILMVIAMLAAPVLAQAQSDSYGSGERQQPNEYQQEDSHPLKIASYAVAPVGFLLEWTVARPLHYLATETPLAPVLSGDRGRYVKPYPLPRDYPDNELSASSPSEQSIAPSAATSQPPAPAKSGSQPVVH